MNVNAEEAYRQAVLSAVSPYIGKLDSSVFVDGVFQGSSDGLMKSLQLIQTKGDMDLTKGRIVSGTGTIDAEGNVGEIGGIKKKLLAAVLAEADFFLVPSSQYKEVEAEKKRLSLAISIVPITDLDQAITYLK